MDNTKIRLIPLSGEGEPDTRPKAEIERRDADLLHQRAEQVKLEQEKTRRVVKEAHVAGSVEAYGESLAMNLLLKTAVRSKTGDIKSTFTSNSALHQYRGAILGMRQRILLCAAAKGEHLPAHFEDYSAAMIVGLFRGMQRVGYFDTATKEAWTEAARAKSVAVRTRRAQVTKTGFWGPTPNSTNIIKKIKQVIG